MKYIRRLNINEENALLGIIRDSSDYKFRQKAHSLLLSHRQFTLEEISKICDVHRDTISRWLDAWQKKGVQSIYETAPLGRPKNSRNKSKLVELDQMLSQLKAS